MPSFDSQPLASSERGVGAPGDRTAAHSAAPSATAATGNTHTPIAIGIDAGSARRQMRRSSAASSLAVAIAAMTPLGTSPSHSPSASPHASPRVSPCPSSSNLSLNGVLGGGGGDACSQHSPPDRLKPAQLEYRSRGNWRRQGVRRSPGTSVLGSLFGPEGPAQLTQLSGSAMAGSATTVLSEESCA